MIKHLRRRFTAVLMSLLGTVMLIVLGSVYVSMYRSENMNTDRIINFAMNLEMHKDNTAPPPQSPLTAPKSRQRILRAISISTAFSFRKGHVRHVTEQMISPQAGYPLPWTAAE